ncbi:MAG: hypothetical protein AB7F65_06675 [Dehalococcoidia bacterium]
MPAPIVRVVGPPGSGKTLLITSLQEALRVEGVRSATAVSRGPGLTAIAISSGIRTTLERDVPLGYLAQVVAWIDPAVDVILAEGYEEAGAPAVELRHPEGSPHPMPAHERLAVLDPADLAAAFAERGPGDIDGIAERILAAVLGREPSARAGGDGSATPEREDGRLGRLFRRLRGD